MGDYAIGGDDGEQDQPRPEAGDGRWTMDGGGWRTCFLTPIVHCPSSVVLILRQATYDEEGEEGEPVAVEEAGAGEVGAGEEEEGDHVEEIVGLGLSAATEEGD